MSLPDHMLEDDREEVDERLCLEHREWRPCGGCYADEADRQYDLEREERQERGMKCGFS